MRKSRKIPNYWASGRGAKLNQTSFDDQSSDSDVPLTKKCLPTKTQPKSQSHSLLPNVIWYWSGDSKSDQQDFWVQFDPQISVKIERAHKAGKKMVSIDKERFLFFHV